MRVPELDQFHWKINKLVIQTSIYFFLRWFESLRFIYSFYKSIYQDTWLFSFIWNYNLTNRILLDLQIWWKKKHNSWKEEREEIIKILVILLTSFERYRGKYFENKFKISNVEIDSVPLQNQSVRRCSWKRGVKLKPEAELKFRGRSEREVWETRRTPGIPNGEILRFH